MKTDKTISPRTLTELRDILFDELDGLRAGTVSPHRARATAALSFQILDSVRVEIIYRTNQLGGQSGNNGVRSLPEVQTVQEHGE